MSLSEFLEFALSNLRLGLFSSLDEHQLDSIGSRSLRSLHAGFELSNFSRLEGGEEQVEFREASFDGSGSRGSSSDGEVVVGGNEGSDSLLSLLEVLFGRFFRFLGSFTIDLQA